ncbi:MAG: alpha/beta fold hydrolase [Pseudomonadota bacterium]
MVKRHYVLVHGVWHGGWCWARVETLLRAKGHSVSAPTQTGLGERAHLLRPGITVEVFVEDIVQHILFEDLSDVVLVGHSFGGIPITGVADRIPERLAKLVYLDAIALETGETWLSLLPEEIAADRTALAEKTSGGLSLPPAPPESFGVTLPQDVAFLAPRLTPHPFETFTSALSLKAPVGNGVPAHYIRCTEPSYPPAKIAHERALALGWPVTEIKTGHDAMVTAPGALAERLQTIAASGT